MAGGFIGRFLLLDLLEGLLVTLRYTFKRKVTIRYPEQIKQPRERFRGLLRLYRGDEQEPLCIACKLCVKACPEDCFEIEGKKEEGKKMRPVKFEWKLARCTFCGLCVEACSSDALRFSKEFRMSTADSARLFFTLDEMYEDHDSQAHFAKETNP